MAPSPIPADVRARAALVLAPEVARLRAEHAAAEQLDQSAASGDTPARAS